MRRVEEETAREETAPLRRTRLNAMQRRESILAAAVEVFSAAGYRAGKVSDVAARVGVSEPVIFQNFGSKSALYRAALDHATTGVSALLHQAADAGRPVPEVLAAFLDPSHMDRFHQPGSHGFLFAEDDEQIARSVIAFSGRNRNRVVVLLDG